jgi:hypothetical protein
MFAENLCQLLPCVVDSPDHVAEKETGGSCGQNDPARDQLIPVVANQLIPMFAENLCQLLPCVVDSPNHVAEQETGGCCDHNDTARDQLIPVVVYQLIPLVGKKCIPTVASQLSQRDVDKF